MIKVLFQTALNELATSDKEGTGNLRYEPQGDTYRYVKNVSATALVHKGACLKALTSAVANVNKNVRSTNTATAATAQLSIPAGVPVTAIAPSGSLTTGCFGWVQVEGPALVGMVVSDTAGAASGWPGWLAIATNLPASDCGWDVPETPTADSASVAYIRVKGVRLLAKFAEGTAGAVRSATVEVMCL